MNDDELERRIRASLARDARQAPGLQGLDPRVDEGHRPRPWVVMFAAAAVLAVCGATAVALGHGSDESSGPSVVASPSVRPDEVAEVDCAGEVETTESGMEPGSPGLATPSEAATAWAGPGVARLEVDEDDGSAAAVLRADGTVQARLRLDGPDDEDDIGGWVVDGSVSCVDGAAGAGWDGARLLGCAPSRVVRAVVSPGSAADRRAFAPVPIVLDHRAAQTTTTADGEPGTGVATTTTSNDGPVHTAARWQRKDDRWRLTKLAECAEQAPGVPPGTGEVTVVGLQATHCWLDPLEHDGTTWEARAQDDFGTGGGMPDRWHGYGVVTEVGATLRYRDLGGADVTFLPAGSPGTTEKGLCD